MRFGLNFLIFLTSLALGYGEDPAAIPPAEDTVKEEESSDPAEAPEAGRAPRTANDLFFEYMRANGGRSAIDSVKSLRMVGQLSMGDNQLRFQMIKKRPARMQLTQYLPDYEWVTVTDGKDAWQYIIRDGRESRVQELRAEAEEAFIESALFDSALMRNGRIPGGISLKGQETFLGIPCYVLTMKEGEVEYEVYLDERTFREVRVLKRAPGMEVEETQYSQYQRIEPLWIPFMIIQTGNELERRIMLESAELNVGVFDSFFRNPLQ